LVVVSRGRRAIASSSLIINEGAGPGLGFSLSFVHVDQQRIIEHYLNGVVPAQVVVLVEGRPHPIIEVGRHPNAWMAKRLFRLGDDLLQPLATVKLAVGSR
jgi:hypothetical protein